MQDLALQQHFPYKSSKLYENLKCRTNLLFKFQEASNLVILVFSIRSFHFWHFSNYNPFITIFNGWSSDLSWQRGKGLLLFDTEMKSLQSQNPLLIIPACAFVLCWFRESRAAPVAWYSLLVVFPFRFCKVKHHHDHQIMLQVFTYGKYKCVEDTRKSNFTGKCLNTLVAHCSSGDQNVFSWVSTLLWGVTLRLCHQFSSEFAWPSHAVH